jgi:crotonobetainyl-CoA:carnitine CoA-transferase CaiB-like acyl-CoA transferase
LVRINPSLTVASITPFGSTGPSSGRPASDLTVYALAGHLLLSGLPSREPLLPYGHQPQLFGGLLAATASLAGAWRSAHDGAPRFVEVSLQEALAGALDGALNGYVFARTTRGRYGNRTQEDTPLTDLYSTKDGYVLVCVYTEAQWRSFCALVDCPEWIDDARFGTWAGRRAHSDELLGVMQRWFAARTSAAALSECQERRLPICVASSIPELLADPQLGARSFFQPDHAEPSIVVPGLPYHIERAGIPAAPDDIPRFSTKYPNREGRKPLPLDGVTVIDFTHAWAGPYAAMQLAYLGATVVKVEGANRPDGARYVNVDSSSIGPIYERGGYFQEYNRNKLSLVLNLTSPGALDVMHELLDRSDVFISNFSTRVLPKFGLDWEVNRRRHPRLIQVSMPAFGSQGPYRDFVGYGEVLEAGGGLTRLSGYSASEPIRAGIAYADPVSGLYGALAAVIGLQRRAETGRGLWLDFSHQEGMARLVGDAVLHFQRTGQQLLPTGNRREDLFVNEVLRCRGDDQWVSLTARSAAEWESILDAAGMDSQSGNRGRQGLQDWCANHDKFEVASILEASGAPVAPVLLVPELLEDPHLTARRFFKMVEHPIWGRRRLPGPGFRFEEQDHLALRHAPMFDSDTDAVLTDLLKLSPERIAELRRDGVVGGQPSIESPIAQ